MPRLAASRARTRTPAPGTPSRVPPADCPGPVVDSADVPTGGCRGSRPLAAIATPLEGFERAVTDELFDPARIEATVTLSCNRHERSTVLLGLIRHFRRHAPGLRLRSIGAGTVGGEQLKSGTCDLLIGPVPVMGETMYRRTLRTERYVLALDQNHPLAESPLTVADFDGLPHVAISFAAHWQPMYEDAFRMRGIALNTVVEVAEHGDIGGYVWDTDLVAIVPAGIADLLSPDLVVRDLPFDVGFSVDLAWTARTHRTPMFTWLRNTIAQLERDAAE